MSLRAVLVLVLTLSLAGCVSSRDAQLRARAADVESKLLNEQRMVLLKPENDPARAARLEHLTSLRETLSAANVARGAVKDTVPSGFRDVAYDVLEEASSTIEWNIPLGPKDPQRAMPRQLLPGGVIKLDGSR
jgi:hypothetical protein